MISISRLRIACFALILLALASPLRAEAEKRIAFVVGNAAYQAGPLATPANDAGLIAQTLQAAGFDVAGARDLDGEALRGALRDFLDKAQAAGPDTVAFVYLSGYGAQLDGDNYFVPVDAKIAAAQDVAIEALRVSDYAKRLAGLPLKASFIVLDAARASPFAKSGQPLAGGLALVDPDPNMLVAFNAAPGTVAPAESGPYGAYARALAEMIREGGLSSSEVFDGVRLRVNEDTKGAQVPWDASRIAAPFVFFERAADAPPPILAQDRLNSMRSQPLRDLGAQDAYAAAIERDTLQGYEEFLAAYPSGPLANRIRGLVAARREAMTWRQTRVVNTPDAYWSYLDRYSRGPHAADARRRLASLTAPEEPPPSYSPIGYDIPPPPPAEIVYVDRPVLIFDDPEFGFVPPPPIVFLAPPPPYLVFPPPVVFVGPFVLPIPLFVPLPIFVDRPPFVAPVNNFISNNIHNTVIVNNTTNTVIVKNPRGQVVSSTPITPAIVPALPPSVAKREERTQPTGATANPPALGQPAAPGKGPLGQPLPGQPGALPSTGSPPGHALPGANGKPLPGPSEKPVVPAQQKPQPASPGAPRNPPGAPSPNKPPAVHALPSAQQLPPLPGGQVAPGGAKPGAKGKPLPGPNEKPVGPAQQKLQPALPGAPGKGAPSPNKPPTVHALPSGKQLPPLPPGHAAPGSAEHDRITPPGVLPPPGQQPLNKSPAGQLAPPDRLAPSGAKPTVPGPGPKVVPKPQQLQQAPKQYQQPHPPQPAHQPPHAPPPPPQWHPPQPAYQPPHAPPPPQQQLRPPQPAYQPPHAPPPPPQTHPPQPAYQPPRAPPPPQQQQKQKPTCGQPGLPPCH
jgi:uncharacterized caspase-like protein